MSQSPQVPTSQSAPASDATSISRNVARRRIAIACGATAGVTFILAGLLAAPALLPNVLDEMRDRDLRPVHIVGSGGTSAAGQGGSAGAPGSPGSSADGAVMGRSWSETDAPGSPGTPGAPGTPGTDGAAPSLILPGGINLSEVLEGTTGTLDRTIDGAKNLVKDTLDGAGGVIDDPTTLPKFIDDTVGGANDLIEDTTSTIPAPPASTDLPVTVPPTTLPAPITTVLDNLHPVTEPVNSISVPDTSTLTIPSLP